MSDLETKGVVPVHANFLDSCGTFILEDAKTNLRWSICVSPGVIDSASQISFMPNDVVAGNIMHFEDIQNVPRRVGFYSAHRIDGLDGPDYQRSLYFFVDETVFGNTPKKPYVQLLKKVWVREFTAGNDDLLKKFQYRWPWYRDFLFGDSMRSSQDVMENLVKALKHVHPDWIRL